MIRALSRVAAATALVVISCALTLVLIEGGFYVYHVFRPANERGFFWEPYADYGWRHKPGSAGSFWDEYGEFVSHVAINSKGLRDVEHAYEKAPGTFRILILGDSYMEAVQVELDVAFPRLLENELNARASRKVEVIDSGVASYGTDNELLYFRHEGYKYQPDLVLLGFTTANDVRENYAPLNFKAPGGNVTKPIFSVDHDGRLEMRPGPAAPPPLPWWRFTYIGQYVHLKLYGPTVFQRVGPPPEMPPKDPTIPFVPIDMWVHQAEYDQDLNEAWRLTKALLLAIRDEATSHGARFALFEINGPWEHYEGDWRRMMYRAPKALETWDRRKPNKVLGGFLWEQHIPSLDLFHAFDAASKGPERLFFRVDPHWTPLGHRVAARAVAQFLLRQDLVPHEDAVARRSGDGER
jgi:hypothetical protein